MVILSFITARMLLDSAATGRQGFRIASEILQAYQEQHITVEPSFRGIKHPVAISPVWLEKPARMAALAILTVMGLLV